MATICLSKAGSNAVGSPFPFIEMSNSMVSADFCKRALDDYSTGDCERAARQLFWWIVSWRLTRVKQTVTANTADTVGRIPYEADERHFVVSPWRVECSFPAKS